MQYQLFTNANNVHTGSANDNALLIRDSAGSVRPADRAEILSVARELVTTDELQGEKLDQPGKTKDFLRLRLAGLEHEMLGILLLDNQLRLIDYQEPFRGTLAQASVYPREVLKIALKANAATVILAHNHPSGLAE